MCRAPWRTSSADAYLIGAVTPSYSANCRCSNTSRGDATLCVYCLMCLFTANFTADRYVCTHRGFGDSCFMVLDYDEILAPYSGRVAALCARTALSSKIWRVVGPERPPSNTYMTICRLMFEMSASARHCWCDVGLAAAAVDIGHLC